jgi:predicted GIY-YIG superfamily endonuclease
MSWVYILQCFDGSYYTGQTNSVYDRLAQHQAGMGGSYTSSRLPVVLVYAREFSTHDDAFRWEQKIKGWSRNKKAALIAGNYDALIDMSKARRGADTRKQAPR